MLVPLKSARFTVERQAGAARFVLPVARSWFGILFMCAWLGGWALGEISAAREVAKQGLSAASAFVAFWLVGWTLGGGYALLAVLWQLLGREIITVSNGVLARRLEIGGVGLSREYSVAGVRALRVSSTAEAAGTTSPRGVGALPAGSSSGLVAFDYGGRTVRFGDSLDEAEAKQLIEQLAPILPSQARQN